jgi:hypothetical protein
MGTRGTSPVLVWHEHGSVPPLVLIQRQLQYFFAVRATSPLLHAVVDGRHWPCGVASPVHQWQFGSSMQFPHP